MIQQDDNSRAAAKYSVLATERKARIEALEREVARLTLERDTASAAAYEAAAQMTEQFNRAFAYQCAEPTRAQPAVAASQPDRATFDAMCAMRDTINEYVPMPSLESDLLQGPENSVFCATVAEAVIAEITRLRAASQQSVRVKPLVWVEIFPTVFEATGFNRKYQIRLGTDGITRWQSAYMSEWVVAASVDVAKAAAQADYEASILAAIKTQLDQRVAVSDAARDVLAERQRQISAEGWMPEHDDEHSNGEMVDAATCYLLNMHKPVGTALTVIETVFVYLWPWSRDWWKPTTRRRDLVKAGALIIAEIERLDRAAKGGAA